MDNCLICERIGWIRENRNPYFVRELKTGYVVLGDSQRFKGYTLFLCKQHAYELHELEPHFRDEFLHEMAVVAEAVYHAFRVGQTELRAAGRGARITYALAYLSEKGGRHANPRSCVAAWKRIK